MDGPETSSNLEKKKFRKEKKKTTHKWTKTHHTSSWGWFDWIPSDLDKKDN